MEPNHMLYPSPNPSRMQSDHNLNFSTQISKGGGLTHHQRTIAPSKKQKLEAILTTLKSYKSSQSTNDLHSAVKLSEKYLTFKEQANCKEDRSLIIDKQIPQNLHQAKEQNQRKYQFNPPGKNYLQSHKKQANSSCYQLKHVLSLDSLQKLKNNQTRTKDIQFLNTTRDENTATEKNSKYFLPLEHQKNSLQAIKQKLQKYGINMTKNNVQSGNKLDSYQKEQKNPQKNRTLMKSISDVSLKSSKQLSSAFLSGLNNKVVDDQSQKIQENFSRPLTSLKQKQELFYQPVPKVSQYQSRLNTSQIINPMKKDTHQKCTSPLKSVTSSNSMTSAKAHAKFFNLNLENFTSQGEQFGQDLISKKPGSYGTYQKPKLTYSDDFGGLLKQKPGSYGSKKCLKSVFQPSSTFSKNSNISLCEGFDVTLKQTIETQSTYTRVQRKLTLKDFTLGRQIGKGKFGRVFLCVHSQTNFLSAIKIIKKEKIRKQRNIQQLIRQIKIQIFLNHSNSVKMYGFFDDHQNIYLLIQYCIEGQLYTMLKVKTRFKEDEALPIIKDICEGLSYLHSQNIIHRDIKPENVVMSFQLSKLCDFGWSVNCQNEKRQTFCGTPLYVSPELLMGKTYDYKVDIWALGIMVYELLTGKLPFHITNEKQLRKIVTNEVKYPEHLSENAKNFIQHLLQKNPSYRNDMETILKHKFLVQGLERLRSKNNMR